MVLNWIKPLLCKSRMPSKIHSGFAKLDTLPYYFYYELLLVVDLLVLKSDIIYCPRKISETPL